MTDPILPFLAIDLAGLLALGLLAASLPPAAKGFPAMVLSGIGALLCVPAMVLRLDPVVAALPFGPPGLALHVALDPLSAFFLFMIFLAGTALLAFQAAVPTGLTEQRVATIGLAGAGLTVIGADAVTIAIGLMALLLIDRRLLPVPFVLLTAICLCGFPATFDTIRDTPPGPWHAAAAVVLTCGSVIAMTQIRNSGGCWTRDSVAAGIAVPLGFYLLVRIPADLCGPVALPVAGWLLLVAGGVIALVRAWQSASAADVDQAMAALSQRQAGLGIAAAGLIMIGRAADFPIPTANAIGALCLLTIGASFAGTLASLTGHVIGAGAGTFRLARMGGLIGLMPGTSAAFAAALFALAALPPGLGFAALWLLLQAILAAPRADGLPGQLPLVLTAGTLAVSAALTTAAAIRLFGIAALGRPRTPRGSGADEAAPPIRNVLLVLSGAALIAGMIPEAVLWLLASPAIGHLTGMSVPPGYNALPFAALLVISAGVGMMIGRTRKDEAKPGGVWADGMRLPYALPFGEPNAQTTGEGFLPPLPAITLPRLPTVRMPHVTLSSACWLVAAAFGIVLLILAAVP